MVRNWKDGKDRVKVLSDPVAGPFGCLVEKVHITREVDISVDFEEVYLPLTWDWKHSTQPGYCGLGGI